MEKVVLAMVKRNLQLAHIIFKDLQFVCIETEKLRTENAGPCMHTKSKRTQ
jgi:hypothetical protein